MNFLPENYELPRSSSSNYFKPQEGENRLRILSKPLFGWEDWSEDKKVFRFKIDNPPKKPLVVGKKVKHFWAMIIWNVQLEAIQVYVPTQSTVQDALITLGKDSEWGAPFNYDIKIFKSGKSIETEYMLNPVPHKPVALEVLIAFKEKPINLEALFTGEDPFASHWDTYTKLMSEDQDVKNDTVKPLYIDHNQFIELSELLQGCADSVQAGLKEYLKKAYHIDSLTELQSKDYAKMQNQLQVRYTENQKVLVEAEMADTMDKKVKK